MSLPFLLAVVVTVVVLAAAIAVVRDGHTRPYVGPGPSPMDRDALAAVGGEGS